MVSRCPASLAVVQSTMAKDHLMKTFCYAIHLYKWQHSRQQVVAVPESGVCPSPSSETEGACICGVSEMFCLNGGSKVQEQTTKGHLIKPHAQVASQDVAFISIQTTVNLSSDSHTNLGRESLVPGSKLHQQSSPTAPAQISDRPFASCSTFHMSCYALLSSSS